MATSKPNYIKIRVACQDLCEVHFRIKTTTPFIRLKEAYAVRVGVPLHDLRFLFDCRRIADHHTAQSLDMEDEDIIVVFLAPKLEPGSP